MNLKSTFLIIALAIAQMASFSQNNANTTANTVAFSEAETTFITNYFKSQFQDQAVDYDNIVTERLENGSYDIFLGKEFDMVPGCSFNLKWNKSLIGSLGEPNSIYKFFNVEATGGGTAIWIETYALKLLNGKPNSVFQLDVPCPFNSPNGCNDSPLLTKIDNNILLFNIGFVGPNDGECCPSWEYEVAYKYQAKKLTLVSKRKVKQLQN